MLIINLGTPDAATPRAVRDYLAQFLWDPRVVETPRLLWWPILHGFILPTRPRRTAQAYASIWTEQGSPLLLISHQQEAAIQAELAKRLGVPVPVALGMRYGRPAIDSALQQLQDSGVRRLLVLPLYPQYSATTSASAMDAVGQALRSQRAIPSLRFIRDYHDEPDYIAAVAARIQADWQQHGRGERLLLSYHGLPQRYVDQGDPYAKQCETTSRLIAEHLGLADDAWLTTYQSRFGPQTWLTPATDLTLQSLARDGVRRVDVVCPGFSADCLETLEENAMQNRDLFKQAGGEHLHYIPCLNAEAAHIAFLCDLIQRNLGGWL